MDFPSKPNVIIRVLKTRRKRQKRRVQERDLKMETKSMISYEMDLTCMAGFGGKGRGPRAGTFWKLEKPSKQILT